MTWLRVTRALLLTRFTWCLCTHDRELHLHYTHGTYCSTCACNGFRRPWPWRRRNTVELAA